MEESRLIAVTDRSYHHGDLRRAVLEVAAEAIAEEGPSRVSLREIARRAGVAHTSVAHHFGDKAGVLGAVAAEGFHRLADDLESVHRAGGGFLELGVAYVRFAVANQAHFEVMFRPDLYRQDAPEVAEARERSWTQLTGGASELAADPEAPLVTAVAGWSLVHGLATLWLSGNLPSDLGDDPEAIARLVAAQLGR